MELYVLVLKIILFYCISLPIVGITAACYMENLKEKRKIIKEIRQEVERLLILKKKKEKKNGTTNEALKVKVQNLHLQNKKLRKVLHETRVEKNLLKKGKK